MLYRVEPDQPRDAGSDAAADAPVDTGLTDVLGPVPDAGGLACGSATYSGSASLVAPDRATWFVVDQESTHAVWLGSSGVLDGDVALGDAQPAFGSAVPAMAIPRLEPDGDHMLVWLGAKMVSEATRDSSKVPPWGALVPQALPKADDMSVPGATTADRRQAMFDLGGDKFVELGRTQSDIAAGSGSGWTEVSGPYAAMTSDLGAMKMRDPSLSADGTVLVFAGQDNAMSTDVWRAVRGDRQDQFAPAKAARLIAVGAADGAHLAPYVAADCSLYFTGSDGRLYHVTAD